MIKTNMSFDELKSIYEFNCKRREILLTEALKQNSPEERMRFVVDYFLNKLDAETISKIDETSPDKIVPFKYDYSFLEDYSSEHVRMRDVRQWGGNNYGFSLNQADVDNRGTEKIKIYPAVYALKMGTCIMFASEIQRFAHDFGLQSQIVEVMDYCYDNFDGLSTENKKIQTDRLIKMQHFYNLLELNGEKYKIDIAGFLTAEDFNKNHPDQKLDKNDFYFSDKKHSPFKGIVGDGKKDILNLSDERQPQ